jgi:hypothetical protein
MASQNMRITAGNGNTPEMEVVCTQEDPARDLSMSQHEQALVLALAQLNQEKEKTQNLKNKLRRVRATLKRQISLIDEQVLESEKHVHHRVVSALALDPEVQLKTFWANEFGDVDGLAKSPLVQPLESFYGSMKTMSKRRETSPEVLELRKSTVYPYDEEWVDAELLRDYSNICDGEELN